MKVLFYVLSIFAFSAYAKGSACSDLFYPKVTMENFDLTVNTRSRVYLARFINGGVFREADGSRTNILNVQLQNGQLYRATDSQVNFRSQANFKRAVMVKIQRERSIQKRFLIFSWNAKLPYATLERAKVLSEKMEFIRDMDGSMDSYRIYDVQFEDGLIARVREEFVYFL